MNREKGASSVLVIIVLVVLIILGLAIMTTSLANKRLSEKKSTWLSKYYELDGRAQEKISEIDEIINQSKYLASSNEAYGSLLEKNLQKNGTEYMMPMFLEGVIGDCKISFFVEEEDSPYNKKLEVTMLVPLDIFSDKNYQILNYQLTQDSLLKDDEVEFEDPFQHME